MSCDGNLNLRVTNLENEVQQFASTDFAFSDGSQTFGSGVKTFTTLPESSAIPTSNNQFVNKSYVDASISFSNVLSRGNTATNSITLNNSGTGSNQIQLLPNVSPTDAQIIITDGTTTNTINKSGYTTRNTNQNATHYLNFSDSSPTGTGAIQKTAGLSCNPATNTINCNNITTNNISSNNSYKVDVSGARLYQELNLAYEDTSRNYINGYYALAKDTYVQPNPSSSGVKAVGSFTNRTATNTFPYTAWSPEIPRLVGVGNNVQGYTSDGISWANATSINVNAKSVCWSPDCRLYVAVGNSVSMDPSFGLRWITETISSRDWRSVTWSPELQKFVAVGIDYVINSVSASSFNGVAWDLANEKNVPGAWNTICWSPQLQLFVVGGNNQKMYSNNGTSWTVIENTGYNSASICWSRQLGILVSIENGNVSISYDGINWKNYSIGFDGTSVCWCAELGLFVATSSSNVYYSANGIEWKISTTSNAPSGLSSSVWLPELGICVINSSTSNNFLTSSLKGRPPTAYNVFDSVYNSIDENGIWSIYSRMNVSQLITTDTNLASLSPSTYINGVVYCAGSSQINLTLPNPASFGSGVGINFFIANGGSSNIVVSCVNNHYINGVINHTFTIPSGKTITTAIAIAGAQWIVG